MSLCVCVCVQRRLRASEKLSGRMQLEGDNHPDGECSNILFSNPALSKNLL